MPWISIDMEIKFLIASSCHDHFKRIRKKYDAKLPIYVYDALYASLNESLSLYSLLCVKLSCWEDILMHVVKLAFQLENLL
jgi:hypothetical protein